MAIFTGTIGNDTQAGTSDADAMDYSQGGIDDISGGGGDDTILAGAGLDPLDRFDGGAGNDLLIMEGDYSAGVIFQADTIHDIDDLVINATGAGANIKLAEGNVAAGAQMEIDCSDVGISIDASALVTGSVLFVLSTGTPHLIGTANDDQFSIFGATDRQAVFDGGPGDGDRLEFLGGASYRAANHTFVNIESIFADAATNLVLADGNIAAGVTLDLGDNAVHGMAMTFDLHKETDGHLNFHGDADADELVVGGHLADTIFSGAGDDTLRGGGGADQLTGGDGADVFVFRAAADSTKAAMDAILDLTGADSIDLSNFDASTIEGGQQHFTQVSALDGHAGQIALVYKANLDATYLVGDVDGDGHGDFWVALGAGDQTGFTGLVL